MRGRAPCPEATITLPSGIAPHGDVEASAHCRLSESITYSYPTLRRPPFSWRDRRVTSSFRAFADAGQPVPTKRSGTRTLSTLDALEPDDRWISTGAPEEWLEGAIGLVEAMR